MPYAVTVRFDIHPGQIDAFLPLILENARASLRDEPGCQQFDVCTDPEWPNHVFLYELYDDLAAFDAHQQMPHYAAMGAAAGHLIAAKELRTYETVQR